MAKKTVQCCVLGNMKTAKGRIEVAVIAGVLLLGGLMGWVVLRQPTGKQAAIKTRPDDGARRTIAATARPFPRQSPPTAGTQGSVKSPTMLRSGKKVTLDPAARSALKRVGFDAEAERYWMEAINNPFLPADERSDLIEDLNEDGLSDPRNPGVGDLPLIASRLRIIEQLMPKAMDRVNEEAFREARKDLLKMQARLAGR
jgi:hypothetical protein